MLNLSNFERAKLMQFLNTISPWQDAYTNASLSIIGFRNGDDIEIVRAKMVLLNTEQTVTRIIVETNSLIGCCINLKEIGESYETALEKLVTNGLSTPIGIVRLIINANENSVSAYFSPCALQFGEAGASVNYFSLRSGRKENIPAFEVVTRELMAAKNPYESLFELASELSVLPVRLEDPSLIEVIAVNILTIDQGRRISGTSAELGLILEPGLKTELCTLGYKICVADKVVERGRIEREDLEWQRVGARFFGKHDLAVPKGAMVQCFASYRGHLQDMHRIFDPDFFPNFRHAIHSAFDSELAVLKKYLFDEKHLQKNARDLEVGVANLFFMLGFSVNPLVGKPLEKAPDLIASSKSGDMLLIECTTELINKEGKLAKLADRVSLARAKLQEAPASHVRVLPMIITIRPLDSITNADSQSALEQGIVLWTRENLEYAFSQAPLPHNSDDLFNRNMCL